MPEWIPKIWSRVMTLVGLPADITPHVLRHFFASLANDLGYSELTIAALIGHKASSVTSRYVHAADTLLLAAADAVANQTLKMLGMMPFAEIIELKRRAEKRAAAPLAHAGTDVRFWV